MAPLTTTTAFAFLMFLAWQVPQADASIGSDVQAVIDKMTKDVGCKSAFENLALPLGEPTTCPGLTGITTILKTIPGVTVDASIVNIVKKLKASCATVHPTEVEEYYNTIKNIVCDTWSTKASNYIKIIEDCNTALSRYTSNKIREVGCRSLRLGKTLVEMQCPNNEYAELENIVCGGSVAFISSLTILMALVISTLLKS